MFIWLLLPLHRACFSNVPYSFIRCERSRGRHTMSGSCSRLLAVRDAGAGGHTNYSTKSTRADGTGWDAIQV